LFHELGLSAVRFTEHDAASHAEDFRINASTAIPRFDVIHSAVTSQKCNQLFQLRTPFYPEVRKLALKISGH
jgi:hypothetical protein